MIVSLGAAGVFYFTQRGKVSRKRRVQRERYLDYLEELREDLRTHEQSFRERSARPDPPATHLLDIVTDPARLWGASPRGSRLPAHPDRHRRAAGARDPAPRGRAP